MIGIDKHHPYVNIDSVNYTGVYDFDGHGKVYGYLGGGNYLVNDAIDIKLASINAQKYQSVADSAIKAYAGVDFFAHLRFNYMSVLYPERVEVPVLYNEHRKIQSLYENIRDNYIYRYQYDYIVDCPSKNFTK